ncbi:MAG: hypothetical protein KJT03_19245 [Verrucomicrobiae bacterium]|nr:hypothetical protein [Verrucomicrobiae bacterium]
MQFRQSIPLFLLVCSILPKLHSQAPESLQDLILTLTISEGTGIFASEGGYGFIPSKTSNQYAIVPLSDTVDYSHGVYNYAKTGEGSAFFVAADSEVGVLGSTNLSFTDSTSGTFTIQNEFGSQSGTFSIEYRLAPQSIERIDISRLTVQSDENGDLKLKIKVRKSDGLETFTDLETTVDTDSQGNIEWTYTPEVDRAFFQVTVNESVAE